MRATTTTTTFTVQTQRTRKTECWVNGQNEVNRQDAKNVKDGI